VIDRFQESYSGLDWSRIYSLRRSELELLLSGKDDDAHAGDMEPSGYSYEIFKWKRNADMWRHFRMLQGASARSLQDANNARYNFLANLSSACKSRCTELGGLPIGSINTIGKVTQSERTAFLNDLKKAEISGTLAVRSESDDEDYYAAEYEEPFHISGSVHIDENKQLVVDAIYEPELPCLLGTCGWDLEVTFPNTASNIYRNARADGYQAPVRKTVWKFKNLRDPNL
jgi:hypothetical protein